MSLKWTRYGILAAGGVLLAAALVRFLILLSPAQSLALPDPLLGIPLRLAVFLAGAVELAAGAVCLFGRNSRVQTAGLAWLATNWVVYRLGLIWMGIHPQGTFLGMLTDPLHLAGTTMGLLVGWLPFGFVALCGAVVMGSWLGGHRAGSTKMFCPTCGGHIRFAASNVGERIPCPHCAATIRLEHHETLKIHCFFCQGHIEFPAHAIGTKIHCPHCRQDITLKESTPARERAT
jgi:DNA-directed RNA polymerase subunit RPC12/RpoP